MANDTTKTKLLALHHGHNHTTQTEFSSLAFQVKISIGVQTACLQSLHTLKPNGGIIIPTHISNPKHSLQQPKSF